MSTPVEPGTRAHEDDRIARVALAHLGEPGEVRITEAVWGAGATHVYAELVDDRDLTGGLADYAERLRSLEPVADLERAHERGIRFVIPGDAEWPAALDSLAGVDSPIRRGGVPLGLWVRGRARLDELSQAVAVVGSRSSTTYGEAVAGEIAATLGAERWCTVSGAAFGIDAAAHRGALARGGATVAVLACGVDRAYPLAHAELLRHVAETGAVVSEAAPGSAPTKLRFLSRNRVIAALCRGTVVVEAAIRSGALNTASWTLDLGRPLLGVPGPVTSAPSAGVHQLLRSRGAVLVTSGYEVLEAIAPMGSYTLAEPREEPRPADRLSLLDRQVLDGVPVVAGADPESISRTAGVRPSDVRAALARLRDHGLVEHALGRWRLAHTDGV